MNEDNIRKLSEQHGLTAKSSAKEIRCVFPNLPEHGAFPEFRILRLIDGIPGFELDHSYREKKIMSKTNHPYAIMQQRIDIVTRVPA